MIPEKLSKTKSTELSAKEESSLSEAEKQRLEKGERFLEDWEYAEDYATEIGESWLEAEDDVIEVPDPPADLPLAESYADVLKFRQGDQAEAFDASVDRGRELFVGKIANCSKCHGEQGLGNGQTTDYDDWTKDWTERVGLKPTDLDTLVPLLARGALPPLNAIPRNFAEGVFRGGSSSQDLYRRITQGIDGSPMPAATFVEGQFEQAGRLESDQFHPLAANGGSDRPAGSTRDRQKAARQSRLSESLTLNISRVLKATNRTWTARSHS